MLGVAVNGRIADLLPRASSAALALFLLLLRIVNSPFGRVLQAIRENDFRAEALGYRTVFYRTLANCLAAAMAALAGALKRCGCATPGPTPRCRFAIMLDILLMVVIGGMGTMYGAVIGATLFILAQNYLQELMGAPSKRGRGAAAAAEPAAPRPLAAVARRAVHPAASTSSRPASSASCAAGPVRLGFRRVGYGGR